MDQDIMPRKKKRNLSCIIIVIAMIVALVILGYLIYLISTKATSLTNLFSQDNSQLTDLNLATLDDPYKGSRQAKVVIVEFSDFECPYCFQEFSIVRQVIETYGDKINFIFRDFPIPNHPHAQKAAEAGECAHEQDKFWQMHDMMFINRDNLDIKSLKIYAQQIGLDVSKFSQCLDSGRYQKEVELDMADGITAGVTGTPTFFINGQIVEGTVGLEFFKKAIDYGLELK